MRLKVGLPVVNEKLANQLLQAEHGFLLSRIRSIGEPDGNPEGVEIRSFGDATAFYIRSMPWPLFNSVKRMTEADAAHIADIARFYREKDRRYQIDIDPSAAGPALWKTLAEHGLMQTGFHAMLYGVPCAQRPDLQPPIAIRQVETEADFDRYAGIHCVGAGMDIAHKHHFARNNIGLLNRTGWRLYLAEWEGQAAAVAAMYVEDGVASLALAATAPEFRGRGLQTALIRWRMHEGHRLNCSLVAAQATFGSSSQNNMERTGMRLAWTRAVYAPR